MTLHNYVGITGGTIGGSRGHLESCVLQSVFFGMIGGWIGGCCGHLRIESFILQNVCLLFVRKINRMFCMCSSWCLVGGFGTGINGWKDDLWMKMWLKYLRVEVLIYRDYEVKPQEGNVCDEPRMEGARLLI